MNWETVIGLEVHAQLKTQSKLFSSAPTAYGALPNTQASFIDAGLPGVLPVLNREAVNMAIRFGLAINATINNFSYFERKNYFYQDLPKGYQISQFQRPIIGEGYLEIMSDGEKKTVTIVRAHLEEDAGKSIHDAHPDFTGVDLNRAGMPLLEIVTAPCLHSAEEAVSYLKTLHQLVRFLGICDGNMQEGSFRCDVNISLRPAGASGFGVRTELKNLNSFRFIEKAILYEQARHQDLLESGQTVLQETRLFSPTDNATYSMRSKENEMDYRYFPDPDLLPIEIKKSDLEEIARTMPRLPSIIREEISQNENLKEDDLDFLLNTPATVHYFFAVQSNTHASDKLLINWLKGTYSAALNEASLTFENPPVSADDLATLLNRVADNKISANQAKIIFNRLLEKPGSVDKLISQEGFEQRVDDNELIEIIKSVMASHSAQVADYKAGKEKLLGFFVGQVMKKSKGQANPAKINELVRQYLNDL